jgi:hypothetical protein
MVSLSVSGWSNLARRCGEACRDTQLERLTPDLEDMGLNPLCGGTRCTDWKWKGSWGQVFLQWWPRHDVWAHGWRDHMIISVCLAARSLQLDTSLAGSLVWQNHLTDAMTDNTSLPNQAHVQYQSGTKGSTVEKPAETLRLAAAS